MKELIYICLCGLCILAPVCMLFAYASCVMAGRMDDRDEQILGIRRS
jgi:hypothetical protein